MCRLMGMHCFRVNVGLSDTICVGGVPKGTQTMRDYLCDGANLDRNKKAHRLVGFFAKSET